MILFNIPFIILYHRCSESYNIRIYQKSWGSDTFLSLFVFVFISLAEPNRILKSIKEVWIYIGNFLRFPKNFKVEFFGCLFNFLNISSPSSIIFIFISLIPIWIYCSIALKVGLYYSLNDSIYVLYLSLFDRYCCLFYSSLICICCHTLIAVLKYFFLYWRSIST